MSLKQFMKAKGVGEYLEAKKNPAKMAEIESRTINQVVENASASKSSSIPIKPHCPKCKSENIQLLGQSRKAFSIGKAVAGGVLTGGIGTLTGFAGKKGKYEWICMNCSNRFSMK